MATQVLVVDLDAAALAVTVRDDVEAVFVVAIRDGTPIALATAPRPEHGRLDVEAVLAGAFTRRVKAEWDEALQRTRGGPLSIAVCTRERPDDLARCLESLDAARHEGHEVLVIDNAPVTGRTADLARARGVRLVTAPRAGLNRARNVAVAAARHRVLAFVDDDVVVSRNWASQVVSAFERSGAACVTGLVLPLELETRGQEEFERYSRQRRDLRPRTHAKRGLRPSAAGVVGMGANMAFDVEILRALGGFDERLDAGTRTRSGGDTDMFARLIDAGHVIVYSPDAFAWHRHRRESGEVRACIFGYGVGLYSMLTKRLIEQRDVGALITAVRWFSGPIVKAAIARVRGHAHPAWSTVLAEAAGAVAGPIAFALEARRR